MAQQIRETTSPKELGSDQSADLAVGPLKVSGSQTYTYNVSLGDVRGKVEINGNTNGAVGRYDYVGLYTAPLPSNPLDYKTFQYVPKLPYQTSELYGPGWVAAYVAWNYLTGKYVYLAHTPATA